MKKKSNLSILLFINSHKKKFEFFQTNFFTKSECIIIKKGKVKGVGYKNVNAQPNPSLIRKIDESVFRLSLLMGSIWNSAFNLIFYSSISMLWYFNNCDEVFDVWHTR